MSKRKRRALLFGAGILAAAAVWLWPPGQWREYVSPPLGKARWRVRLRLPGDWQQRAPAVHDRRFDAVTLMKPRPLAWMPAWLRNHITPLADGDEYLLIVGGQDVGPEDGLLEADCNRWFGDGNQAHYVARDSRRMGTCHLIFVGGNEGSARDLRLIQQTLRVTHE